MENDNRKFGLISILKLTLPSIIMMSFMSLYTMVDGAFVSKFVGTDALSAVNIVYPFINFIIGISSMIATGGCALVMKKLGEGKEEEARKDFSLIIAFAIIVSIVITILGIVFINPIIKFLGATKTLQEYCREYLFYMILFTLAMILKFIFEQFLIAVNKAGLALTLSFLGGILNIILDYFFIGVLNFGIKGAAIATNLGYAIPAIIGLIVFFSKKNSLYYQKPSKDLKVIAKSCTNGCSEMISQISNGIITFLFNLATLKLIGEDGVAAITIILFVQFLTSAIFIGYSMGIEPKISFYYGNGDKYILKKIINNSLKFIWGSSILIYVLTLIFSPVLISFFAEEGTNVFTVTLKGLKIYSLAFLLNGTNIFMSGMFTAFSNGFVSGAISFLRSLIFESFGIIIFSSLFAVTGLWSAIPIAQVLGVIVSMTFYFKYKKVYGY